jgi:hypothetical protein
LPRQRSCHPTGGDSSSSNPADSVTPAEPAATSRPLVDEDGVPYFIPEAFERERQPRVRETATYRASFASEIRKSGIDSLIKSLETKNAKK